MVIKAVRSIIEPPYKDLWGRRGWKGKGKGKGKEETCPISLKEPCRYMLVKFY